MESGLHREPRRLPGGSTRALWDLGTRPSQRSAERAALLGAAARGRKAPEAAEAPLGDVPLTFVEKMGGYQLANCGCC